MSLTIDGVPHELAASILNREAAIAVRNGCFCLSDEQVKEQFPDLPQRGLWTEAIDFSEKEYSSNWGSYGFLNGKHIYSSGGTYSRLGNAIEASKEWKKEMKADYMKQMDAKIKRSLRRQTWGTGYIRQD